MIELTTYAYNGVKTWRERSERSEGEGGMEEKRARLTLAKVKLKELTHLKVADGSLPNLGVV